MESNENRERMNEAENENNSLSFVATKATSWPIVLGSLDDTVTCESSLSSVDAVDNSASRNPALVLRRPFRDCGHCEIKISFDKKHEIRQVYVKSTARVYEIYYAADAQSMNEYLCTVRCGLAAKDEEFVEKEEYLQKTTMYLQKTTAVTSTSTSSSGSIKLLEEGEIKTDSGSSANEDGWVDIKDPDSYMIEDGDSSHSNKIEARREKEKLDFYEAAAEISDANPFMSMTIRLLSIQSGESVYLDEVYVFADPVEWDDVNSTSNSVECSTGNSLMSMLIPSLLQLSKERGAYRGVFQNMSSGSTSAKIQLDEIRCTSDEQEVVTDKLNCASDQQTRLEVPTQPSKGTTTSGLNLSSNHTGTVLDELVSRMARIDELFLRFEEKMINPITSMDARLEKVEQQLELLNEKFKLPQTHSSTRICAPEFSCNASESNSFYNDGDIIPCCQASESLKKDDHLSDEVPAPISDTASAENAYLVPDVVPPAPELSSLSGPLKHDDRLCDEIANQVSDMPLAVSPHLVPSLVVTAPEFSYGDEDEEHDNSKSVGGSPQDNLKKPRSIDDALTFALAGFLSSTLTEHLRSDAAPDTSKTVFTSKKAGTDILVSEHVECNEPVVVAHHINATSETSIPAVAENGEQENPHFGRNSEQRLENIAGEDHVLGEDSVDNCLVHDVEGQICHSEKTFADEEIVIREEGEVGNAYIEGSKSSSEVAIKVRSASCEEGVREASSELHSILNLPINSVVDYKIPILDVKFSTQECSSITTSLEALLSDITATDMKRSSVEEKDVGEFSDHDHQIEPDNSKVTASECFEHLSKESDLDYLSNLSFDNKGTQQELYESCNQDMSVGLL